MGYSRVGLHDQEVLVTDYGQPFKGTGPSPENVGSAMTFNTNGKITHAGWRTANEPALAWTCNECTLENPGYRAQCQKCNNPRPDRR